MGKISEVGFSISAAEPVQCHLPAHFTPVHHTEFTWVNCADRKSAILYCAASGPPMTVYTYSAVPDWKPEVDSDTVAHSHSKSPD